MTNFTGQDIGRYRIIELLGQGGMATVYRAYDTHLECEVAVKFIRMDQVTPAEVERTLKRFEREAKEVARLTHPSIVKVTDYGEYKGTPYLVMVYLSGGTLKQLAGKPLPYEQAARLLAPVARALEYAHEKNIIHRDIKPGNILLTDKGQPMVSDFGIAKILGLEGGNTLTSTNVAIGTPEYMAPEQWFNQISAQSDIYSLGVVFYELVTGRKPYTADTPAAIFLKQSTDPLPRPRSFVPGLPEEVERVLYKALAKKPEDRYASMGEFAAALEGLAGLVKAVQSPHPEVFETVSARPAAPAAAPKPPEPQVFQTEETGLEMPASHSAWVSEPPTAKSAIIPVSLPLKDTPARSHISGWIWAVAGIIVLTGLVMLIRWGIGKYASILVTTQTAPALAALPPTFTPVLVMPTITPASTQTMTPTQLPSEYPTNTISPSEFPTNTPASNLKVINADNVGKLVALRELEGNKSTVNKLVFSPDSQYIASAGDDKVVRVWRVGDGSLLYELKGHTGSVKSLVFSPDGKILASGGKDKKVFIWDVIKGDLIRSLDTNSQILLVSIYKDGKSLAVTTSNLDTKIYDMTEGTMVKDIGGPNLSDLSCPYAEFNNIATSPDGQFLAISYFYYNESGFECGVVVQYQSEFPTKRLVLRPFGWAEFASPVGYSNDGQYLAYNANAGYDFYCVPEPNNGCRSKMSRIELIQTKDGTVYKQSEKNVYSEFGYAFSPTNDLLIFSAGNKVEYWSVNKGDKIIEFARHVAKVTCEAFSSDGSVIASGDFLGHIYLWGLP